MRPALDRIYSKIFRLEAALHEVEIAGKAAPKAGRPALRHRYRELRRELEEPRARLVEKTTRRRR